MGWVFLQIKKELHSVTEVQTYIQCIWKVRDIPAATGISYYINNFEQFYQKLKKFKTDLGSAVLAY